MRILLLNNRWEPGGTRRHLRDLASGLSEAGHSVTIAAWSLDEFSVEGIRTIRLPLYRENGRRKSPLGFVHAIRSLTEMIASERIEVVHMHNRYVLPLGFYASKGTPARRVYTAHYHSNNLKSLPWYPLHNIFPTQWLRDEFVGTIAKPERFHPHVIVHGVREPAGSTEHRSEERDAFLFVGRLFAQKGARVFLDAIKILDGKGLDCKAVIVGDGPARAECESLAGAMMLNGRVAFEGFRESLQPYFGRAVALVVPSLQAEGFGYVVLEGLQAGCRVIASDLPPFREIDGGTGIVQFFKAGDAVELSSRLEECFASKDEAQRRARASQRVRETFTFERMIERTVDVYEACMREDLRL